MVANHTPIPALAPTLPLFSHAPSVYTCTYPFSSVSNPGKILFFVSFSSSESGGSTIGVFEGPAPSSDALYFLLAVLVSDLPSALYDLWDTEHDRIQYTSSKPSEIDSFTLHRKSSLLLEKISKNNTYTRSLKRKYSHTILP